MYSYGQVEAALAGVHQIPPNAIGAFRGRIKHFQKIGIVPSSPGKGRRIEYTIYDVYVWGIALELAEFGMDPTTIKKIVYVHRRVLLETVFDNDTKSDLFFFFHPSMLGKDFLWPFVAPDLSRALEQVDAEDTAETTKFVDAFRARHGAINLSRLRRVIESALPSATSA